MKFVDISAINNNPFLFEQVKAVSSQDRFDKENFQYQDYKSFIKYTSQEQQNTIVSEKTDEAKNLAEYNLRLRKDVPLSRPGNSSRVYNPKAKTPSIEILDEESGEFVNFIEIKDEEQYRASDFGKGFYVGINSSQQKSIVKKFMNPSERFQQKVSNLYHRDIRKKPGTLVNLVF